MAENVEIRIPKWLVYILVAVLLIGAGVGAGLVVGGEGSDATVAAGKRPKSTTSTSTSTTSTTAAPVGGGGGNAGGGNGGGGNAGNNGGGDGGGAALPPAAPAATADVTSSKTCPQQVITWAGTGGVSYTLQVYNAVQGGAPLHNGPVEANGQKSFQCAGNPGGIMVPTVGTVRFNTNTATGTVSDTAQ